MVKVVSAGLVSSERLAHCLDSQAEVLWVARLASSADVFAQLRFPGEMGDELAEVLHGAEELGAFEFMLSVAFEQCLFCNFFAHPSS